jgi:hypothetical protein
VRSPSQARFPAAPPEESRADARLFACGDTTNVAARGEQLNKTIGDGPYADSDDAAKGFSKQHLPSDNRPRRVKHYHTGVTRREFGDSTGDGLRRLSLVGLLR